VIRRRDPENPFRARRRKFPKAAQRVFNLAQRRADRISKV
jgi:hypothetical protein